MVALSTNCVARANRTVAVASRFSISMVSTTVSVNMGPVFMYVCSNLPMNIIISAMLLIMLQKLTVCDDWDGLVLYNPYEL